MKKLNLLLVIFIGLTIISCSSDDDENNLQISANELLVQNSPWTFKNYVLVTVTDQGNSALTQQELENDANESLQGALLTFYADGTGNNSFDGQNSPSLVWHWEIINGNQLSLTNTDPVPETTIFENFSVSEAELTLNDTFFTRDHDIGYTVLHIGTLFFE